MQTFTIWRLHFSLTDYTENCLSITPAQSCLLHYLIWATYNFITKKPFKRSRKRNSINREERGETHNVTEHRQQRLDLSLTNSTNSVEAPPLVDFVVPRPPGSGGDDDGNGFSRFGFEYAAGEKECCYRVLVMDDNWMKRVMMMMVVMMLRRKGRSACVCCCCCVSLELPVTPVFGDSCAFYLSVLGNCGSGCVLCVYLGVNVAERINNFYYLIIIKPFQTNSCSCFIYQHFY